MKELILSIILSVSILSNSTDASEAFQVLHSSEIGKDTLVSVPSVEFLRRGSDLKKGALFRFDIQKFRKIAIGYAEGIKGFSKLINSSVSMTTNPDGESSFYFLVTLVDENKNCLRIVMNGEYEVWPLGEAHDPFK